MTEHTSAQDWAGFEKGLAAYLLAMLDADDHLIVELQLGERSEGVGPYAVFSVPAEGWLRAELAGNAVLLPQHRLDDQALAGLYAAGWSEPEEHAPNLWRQVPFGEAQDLAGAATRALAEAFRVVHPSLLTRHAWGPAAAHVGVLGLSASTDVVQESFLAAATATPQTPPPPEIVWPETRPALLEAVAATLERHLGAMPERDSDGNFLLHHAGADVAVLVHHNRPELRLWARVVANVRSRQQTAVELSVLNRENPWSKWVLVGHDVVQKAFLPGRPFVPAHLTQLVDHFLEQLDSTQSDLVLRTGGAWV